MGERYPNGGFSQSPCNHTEPFMHDHEWTGPGVVVGDGSTESKTRFFSTLQRVEFRWEGGDH